MFLYFYQPARGRTVRLPADRCLAYDIGIHFYPRRPADIQGILMLAAVSQKPRQQIFIFQEALRAEAHVLLLRKQRHIEDARLHKILEEVAAVGQLRHQSQRR